MNASGRRTQSHLLTSEQRAAGGPLSPSIHSCKQCCAPQESGQFFRLRALNIHEFVLVCADNDDGSHFARSVARSAKVSESLGQHSEMEFHQHKLINKIHF